MGTKWRFLEFTLNEIEHKVSRYDMKVHVVYVATEYTDLKMIVAFLK